MDAVGHALITTGFSDDPLAIVASAINLRYNEEGIGRLRDTIPPPYSGFADGAWSHIVGNRIVNPNPHFLAMRGQSREILGRHGINTKFSEVAMESCIDHLLLEDPSTLELVSGFWDRFDWQTAAEYLPAYSRDPERARRNIAYVRQRFAHLGPEYVSHWLAQVIQHITGMEQEQAVYSGAVEEITHTLRQGRLYLTLLDEAKKEIQAKNITRRL